MYFDPRLWRFTQGVRGRIAAAVALGMLAAAVGVARLALLGWLLAQLFQGVALDALVAPALLVGACMMLRGAVEYYRAMVAHRTAARVLAHIRARLYDKLVALGPAHVGQQRTGGVVVSMVDGVEQLETYFGQYLPQLCVGILTPVAIFAFAAFLDWQVAAVLLFAALFTLVAPQAFHRWDRDNSLRRARAYKAFAAEFMDSIQGLPTLKAFGQSKARGASLAAKAEELFRSTMWVLATNSAARGITDAGIAIGTAAALGLGAWRVTEGQMELTALIVLLMIGIEMFRPLRDLRALLHQGMVAQASAQAVFQLLDAEPPLKPARTAMTGVALTPSIRFEDVAFAYPGGRGRVHDGLSFSVGEGQRIGIVGASGGGKSTIVKLLLRFHDPEAGTVRIGGRDLRDLSLADIRAQIATVGQDTTLFHGTVAENLRLGKLDATQAELEAAARDANAHDFIQALPQGYDTVVGERGLRLSGGQRQRIAIARALLRDAPILVLDEALSSVDAENEAAIQQALDQLMVGRTTLIIAHRLSSVIGADRILLLEAGRVAEAGTHRELMARNGAYASLMVAQAAEAEAGSLLDAATPRPGAPARRGAGAADTMARDTQDLDTKTRDGGAPDDDILRAEGLGWAGAIRALLTHIRPYPGRMALTLLFGVTRVLALIGVGAVAALTVRAVKTGEPFTDLLIALAVLAPVAGIVHWLESWVAHDMAFRLLARMRVALFHKLDALAPAYMLRRRSGDLVAMATHDVELVEYFFAHTVAPAVVAVLIPAGVLLLLASFGWQMAAALLPFLAIVALSPFFLRKRVDRLGSQAREALGDLNAHAADSVQGLGEIAAFQQESARRRGLLARMDRHQRLRMPFLGDLTLQAAALETATGLGGLAVVIAGAGLVQAGAVDVALLPLFSLLGMAAFLPVSEIAEVSRQLADTLGATRRLEAVNNEPVRLLDGPGVDLPAGSRGLALAGEGVTYSYDGRTPPALAGVDFAIPAGGALALVGPSGAGKTTLAHLIVRFWDPNAGRITLGGQDLRDFGLDDLRARVALVAQDTYLFHDSLRANIRIARPDASDAEILLALERAALGDFVTGLPQGLDTPVGERGMNLSGGQRQRVAIARAFLKDAPVLVLDEATSHLDAASEAAVRRALDDLMADRTTVAIAHRLSTVRNADRIVVLENGRVAESGDHDALLAKGGLYAHLVARQAGGAAAAA